MAVTISTNYLLKTLWPQSRVENLVYPDHPFLALIPKMESFYGENMYLAVRGADSQGRSAAFATAQAAAGAHAGKRFLLTRATDYQVCALTTEAIMAAKNDKGALIRNLDTEIESGMNNISKSLAVSLFRGQSGVLGAVGAVSANAVSPATITLSNINDVTSFEVGMVLTFNATKAAGAGTPHIVHGGGSTATVTGIDRDLGILYFADSTFNTDQSTVAANDYLFANGDRNAKVSGLDDWLPSTAPTFGTDSFFGVDRSTDATRYAGLRIDVSALNPEEACITALSRINREGGAPKHLVVNHLDYRNIAISLGSKVEYESLSVGEIGFQAIKVHSAKGPVSILADQDCPQGTGYALQMDSWKLYSLDKCPQILDLDGNRLSRTYNADTWEARIVYFAQLGCTAPGYNGRLLMPT